VNTTTDPISKIPQTRVLLVPAGARELMRGVLGLATCLLNGLGGGGHHGIEVARRFLIDQIAPAVAFPRFDESEIPTYGVLQNVVAPRKLPRLFSFGNHGAVSGGGVERRNARTARAQTLGERALRIQFHLEFPAHHQALEEFVFADVAGDHFSDLRRHSYERSYDGIWATGGGFDGTGAATPVERRSEAGDCHGIGTPGILWGRGCAAVRDLDRSSVYMAPTGSWVAGAFPVISAWLHADGDRAGG
jgi:hypothetical protein